MPVDADCTGGTSGLAPHDPDGTEMSSVGQDGGEQRVWVLATRACPQVGNRGCKPGELVYLVQRFGGADIRHHRFDPIGEGAPLRPGGFLDCTLRSAGFGRDGEFNLSCSGKGVHGDC